MMFDSLVDLAKAANAQDAERMIRGAAARHPGSEYELALYAFRSLRVPQPEVYAVASLRSRRAADLAAQVASIADAIQLTRQVPGRESILRSADRVALPGEVLLCQTGNHRDKALLLHALIQLAEQIPADAKRGMRVVFGENESAVQIGGQTISGGSCV